MGVSKNMGTPKWMVYNGKPYFKWMIWGYSYFRKKSILYLHNMYTVYVLITWIHRISVQNQKLFIEDDWDTEVPTLTTFSRSVMGMNKIFTKWVSP